MSTRDKRPLGSTSGERAASLPGIFSDALALPPEARATFLDAACGGDLVLRAEIVSLLCAHPVAGEFFGQEPSLAASAEVLAEWSGTSIGADIGPYRITRPIATGGMGSVFLAERTDEAFRKQVAIKLIRPDLWGTEAVQRFRTERQVLAELEHPGIARLLDGGSTAAGVPYFVMEYVDGVPITRYCSERGLDVVARLELFIDVCEAVRYAHQNLVIHRDLKPSNILVDGSGSVKLLDFGIAKVIGNALVGESLDQTRTSSHAFTPRYASPEQAAGRRMTTATDIYSLGVILYELLTEHFPYDLEGKTLAEATETITSASPARPSRRAAPEVARRLTGDLDMIVLKALSKEPERRYPTVEEFAADIRRHQDGLPVHARPDTPAYRVSKFISRNQVLVGGTASTLVVLIAALGMTLRAYREARTSQHEAEAQVYISSLVAAEASLLADNVAEAEAQLDAAPAHFRGWEWHHLRARLDRSLTTFQAHRQGITRIAFSVDESVFLTASIDSTVKVWRGRDGQLESSHGPFSSGVETAAFVPRSNLLAVGLNDGAVLLVDRTDGSSRKVFPSGATTWALLSVSPDGSQLACGFFDGFVRIWSLPVGTQIAEWKAHEGIVITAYSPDGTALATGGTDGLARIYDAHTYTLLREFSGHARRVYSLGWSPDGSRLATGSMDQTVNLWDVHSNGLRTAFREHRATINAMAFDPAGERIATSAADHRLFVWDASTGGRVSSLRGHRPDVTAIAASRDCIVTGDWSGGVKSWAWGTEDVRTLQGQQTRWAVPTYYQAALDPAETTLVCASNLYSIPVWRMGNDAPRRYIHDAPGRRIAFTPDGSDILVGSELGTLLLFHAEDSVAYREAVVHPGPVLGLAIEPEGAHAATSSLEGLVKLWTLPQLDSVRVFAGHVGTVTDVEFSPSGRLVASGGEDGSIRVWDTASAEPLHMKLLKGAVVRDIAFDAEGRRIASAASDGSVELWDLESRSSTTLRKQGRFAMTAVAWSADGTRLAAGGADDNVRLYDLAFGREVVTLHGHVGRITSLRFVQGDEALISTAADGTVRLWEARRLGSR